MVGYLSVTPALADSGGCKGLQPPHPVKINQEKGTNDTDVLVSGSPTEEFVHKIDPFLWIFESPLAINLKKN